MSSSNVPFLKHLFALPTIEHRAENRKNKVHNAEFKREHLFFVISVPLGKPILNRGLSDHLSHISGFMDNPV